MTWYGLKLPNGAQPVIKAGGSSMEDKTKVWDSLDGDGHGAQAN